MTDALPDHQRDVPAGTTRVSPLEAQKLHHLAAPLKAMLREHDPVTALKVLSILTVEIMMEVRLRDPADSRTALYDDFAKGVAASIVNEVKHRERRPM